MLQIKGVLMGNHGKFGLPSQNTSDLFTPVPVPSFTKLNELIFVNANPMVMELDTLFLRHGGHVALDTVGVSRNWADGM